ncbi:hypothetical protein HYG86_01210 [Alkalicella caledoniensis]|uniref:Uncharacterized protein n=1 Tax=Alkalicella caledoniensis TaxID=2731377 RepID=A0A7G9W470_ALKCA|nr:hypothetical protein [Alkalicella caledoniensis]QNO13482.1 hypothetical protein HYG86_01210 [Alkalicella caledoniensis]
MSIYQFLASSKPLKEVKNPYIKMLSINEMLARKMKVPSFLLDSPTDRNEKIVLHFDSEEHLDEIEITIENNIPMDYLKKYTSKNHIYTLSWRYTEKRAKKLLQYIQEQLKQVEEIELWNTWMDEKIEGITLEKVNIKELTVQLIEETLGEQCYDHPKCLKVTKCSKSN